MDVMFNLDKPKKVGAMDKLYEKGKALYPWTKKRMYRRWNTQYQHTTFKQVKELVRLAKKYRNHKKKIFVYYTDVIGDALAENHLPPGAQRITRMGVLGNDDWD